ncbi:hypothetical protein HUT06_34330 [Actinomadura sp. NAK00032]|uniref:hypothetical protein n=1 Tax=Actinomadura sp. NAK00032 TaxID=2742128 RepID=UPI001591CF02|nr:hypothetical protein [Actinomadura sp. NAK00032]QKW38467.1 hypothetical protein HUT06_34330 [Actinomadura sp. NAK00032]
MSILGSGQGSVSTCGILAELPSLAAEITSGALSANPVPVPLRDVEEAWTAPAGPGRRLVLTC